jgi:hypothetical protein
MLCVGDLEPILHWDDQKNTAAPNSIATPSSSTSHCFENLQRAWGTHYQQVQGLIRSSMVCIHVLPSQNLCTERTIIDRKPYDLAYFSYPHQTNAVFDCSQ